MACVCVCSVLTCGRKLLGLWPSTPGKTGDARTSSPNFSQPDSVILQVRQVSVCLSVSSYLISRMVCVCQLDFPSSSFDVVFSTPPPADFCPQYHFAALDKISQIQLKDVLRKKAVFW